MRGIVIIRVSKYSPDSAGLAHMDMQTDKRLCSGFILIFASLLVVLEAFVLKANDISTFSFPGQEFAF